ncbi:MAG: thioredoxin domain-containing protein [Candidatus Melainabacteria bacterium]|nr:thioredoxin domain-containing protein [Candidatus Melainabacteria bacterium]
MSNKSTTPNRLINEKSPYLLQHAYNPVNWYPWGEEAFEKAKNENKPVFLSIGYSTCHWCHVMEKESFENEEVASLLNDVCVPIKVDREERPDIDHIYMTVCQVMTGSGGWPLNLFLTPDKRPFFAGTYFPPKERFGRIGFYELLMHIRKIWDTENTKAVNAAKQIVELLEEISTHSNGVSFDKTVIDKAFHQLKARYDVHFGGFGSSPKFPSPHLLLFLLRYYKETKNNEALEMVENTLTSMRSEGIYDHIGFGFHRYATDEKWHLPHFEKMLYDQAMHIMAYTEAYQVTKKDIYKNVSCEIIEYLMRDMLSPEGGFYVAEDADSEGEEGKYYVWSKSELKKELGSSDFEMFQKIFYLEDEGNFLEEATKQKTGSNVICFKESLEKISEREGISVDKIKDFIDKAVKKLLKKRQTRIPPQKDDKILTDWNGLLIAALAKAGVAFKEQKYTHLAINAYSFIKDKMTRDNKLQHSYRDGVVKGDGTLDDYSFLVWGLIELYEATFEESYLIEANELNKIILKHFKDDKSEGFFFMPDFSETVLVRKKEYFDGAIPSGNSVSLYNLARLAKYFNNLEYADIANKALSAFGAEAKEHPIGFMMFMVALEFLLNKSQEVVIVGDSDDKNIKEILNIVSESYKPNCVKLFVDTKRKSNISNPMLKDYKMLNNKPTIYICENYACKEPITDISKLSDIIK